MASTRTRKPYLPKTGQTTSYYGDDDGDYESGSPITPRFIDNGDGTITDRVTNLMWVKDGTGLGCNSGTAINWQGCIDFAEALDFAGYTDWRLPNIMELVSITDFGTSGPSIDALFTNTASGRYWSSTTPAGNTSLRWLVIFDNGHVDREYPSDTYDIRPVRGGQF